MPASVRVLASLAILVIALAAAPIAAAAGPTRTVIDLNDPALDAEESATLTAECGFPVIARNRGHIIVLAFPAGKRSINEIAVYGIGATYTNGATGTLVRLSDAGPDRFYVRDGRAYVAVTGRSTTGTGVIGQTVIDLETGDVVKSVGNDVGVFWDQICAALSG